MFSELYKREYIVKNSQEVDNYWGLIARRAQRGKMLGDPSSAGHGKSTAMVWGSVVSYQLITASSTESAVTAAEVNPTSSHRKKYYSKNLFNFVK
jgi:hypothetical protein